MTVRRIHNIVDGEFVDAADGSSSDKIDPVDGSVSARVHEADMELGSLDAVFVAGDRE